MPSLQPHLQNTNQINRVCIDSIWSILTRRFGYQATEPNSKIERSVHVHDFEYARIYEFCACSPHKSKHRVRSNVVARNF